MSELLESAQRRKELLRHMILQLHKGEAPEEVRDQRVRLLGQVPYGEVVEVEQQMVNEGVPTEEIQKLCDLHSAALKGLINIASAPSAPEGHPADTFRKENAALGWEVWTLPNSTPIDIAIGGVTIDSYPINMAS